MDEQEKLPAEEVKKEESLQDQAKEANKESILGPTLTSLVEGLSKAIEDAKAIVLKYQKKINELAELETSLESKSFDVLNKQKSFEAREAACKNVEDAVALHAEGKRLMDSANLRLETATEAECKLNDATTLANAQIADSRALAQREANAVIEQRKNIEKEVSERVSKTLENMGIKPIQLEEVKPVEEQKA